MSITLPEIPEEYRADAIPYSYVVRSKKLYEKCLKYLSLGKFPCFVPLCSKDNDVIVDPMIKRLKEAGYGARIFISTDEKFLAIDKVSRL